MPTPVLSSLPVAAQEACYTALVKDDTRAGMKMLKALVTEGQITGAEQRTIVSKYLSNEEGGEILRKELIAERGEVEGEHLEATEGNQIQVIEGDTTASKNKHKKKQGEDGKTEEERELAEKTRVYVDEALGIDTSKMKPKEAKAARKGGREKLIGELMKTRRFSRVEALDFINSGGLDQEKAQAQGAYDQFPGQTKMFDDILAKGPPDWFVRAMEENKERERLKAEGTEEELAEFEEKCAREKEERDAAKAALEAAAVEEGDRGEDGMTAAARAAICGGHDPKKSTAAMLGKGEQEPEVTITELNDDGSEKLLGS